MADWNGRERRQALFDLLRTWVERQASPSGAEWLRDTCEAVATGAPDWQLFTSFSAVPRRIGKSDLALTNTDRDEAHRIRPGWRPDRWSLDEAGRAMLLLAGGADGEATMVERFTRLFHAADVREAVALHKALPVLPHPEGLRQQAVDGLRTNMTSVFDALALFNPYPMEVFGEDAWNQMVLKAVFVGSPLGAVVGLDERANERLARMLVDYAHERWSAGREVPPDLWRVVGPFAAGPVLDDLARVYRCEDAARREAAALALAASPDPRADALLEAFPATASAVDDGSLSWPGWSRAHRADDR